MAFRCVFQTFVLFYFPSFFPCLVSSSPHGSHQTVGDHHWAVFSPTLPLSRCIITCRVSLSGIEISQLSAVEVVHTRPILSPIRHNYHVVLYIPRFPRFFVLPRAGVTKEKGPQPDKHDDTYLPTKYIDRSYFAVM